MKKFLSLVLIWVMTCCLPLGGQASGPNADAVIDSILSGQCAASDAKDVQAYINTTLAKSAGTGAEWYAVALCQLGGYDFSAYNAALYSYLNENQVRSAVTRQKYALALLASGDREHPFIAATMEDSPGQQGIMSIVYALHLMNNGFASDQMPVQNAIDQLLTMQLSDGGWAITGANGDVDVTAMTLQALAPHREDHAVAAAIEKALTLLSKRQQADGSFMSYGIANAESIAQVWIALSALQIDALKDDRFIKNDITVQDALLAFQLPDHTFCHKMDDSTNPNATVQALHAFIGYRRMLDGKTPLLVLDQPTVSAMPAAWSYKTIAALGAIGAGLLTALLLLLFKKKSIKNYLLLLTAVGGIITFIFTTDFSTADNYYQAAPPVQNAIGTVSFSIRCDVLLPDHTGEYIPADGIILPVTAFDIAEGDTVYTLLTRAAQAHKIHLESSGPKGMIYIAGIAHLYELDYGDLSGWVYLVNGERPSLSCDQYRLKDGDHVLWQYTLALGDDL